MNRFSSNTQIGGEVLNLGLVDFAYAWELQKKIFYRIKEGELRFTLIICRHFPVITFGKRDGRKDLLVPEEALKARGIAVYDIERGGRATYHGPGQLTVYPIADLNYFKKDIHWFLRALERVIISCLSGFGILANQRPGLTGAWVGEKKICSIGIAIKNWISWHGLSLNVSAADLENFNLIRPCGMDIAMTAMENELNRHLEIEPVAENLVQNFSQLLPIADPRCTTVHLGSAARVWN